MWWRKKKQKKSQRAKPEHIYDMPNFQMGPYTGTKPVAMKTNPSYGQINRNRNTQLAVTNPALFGSQHSEMVQLPTSPGVQEPVILCEMNANVAYATAKENCTSNNSEMVPDTLAEGTKPVANKTNPSYGQINTNILAVMNPASEISASPEDIEPVMLCEMNANVAYDTAKQN